MLHRNTTPGRPRASRPVPGLTSKPLPSGTSKRPPMPVALEQALSLYEVHSASSAALGGQTQPFPAPQPFGGPFCGLDTEALSASFLSVGRSSFENQTFPSTNTPASAGPAQRHGSSRGSQPRKTKRRRKNSHSRSDSDFYCDSENNTDDTIVVDEDDEGHSDEPKYTLACPFYKLDSKAHWRCLEKHKLKRIGDVKQHIRRCHVLKTYYCPTCWHDWSNAEPWKAHIVLGGCTEAPKPDSLDRDEVESLKSLPKGSSLHQKWYSFWDVLFPSHEPPSSPFVQDGLEEPVAFLRSVGKPSLLAQLPGVFQHHNIHVDNRTLELVRRDIERIAYEFPLAPRRFRQRPATAAATAPSITMLEHDQQRVSSTPFSATRALISTTSPPAQLPGNRVFIAPNTVSCDLGSQNQPPEIFSSLENLWPLPNADYFQFLDPRDDMTHPN